ncbi:unnamed protein product [Gemmata massiliana]|uniref:Lipoprotein n=1 Tax=Gemmata massiliana TaxID=1210884 RepID=A0A6P2D685_9BACT|nr:hypothetical protein [Gemmata massiliana]VTR95965.1 unnamed protein product [Gemmata massiliana]
MRHRLMLAALFAALLVGCDSSVPSGQTGKEVEEKQKAAQQKADDEEKQEIKDRKSRNK